MTPELINRRLEKTLRKFFAQGLEAVERLPDSQLPDDADGIRMEWEQPGFSLVVYVPDSGEANYLAASDAVTADGTIKL